MKLAIMQPYLFPYLGYYQLIHAVDRFVIADDVTYIKGGWINRNRILVNGEAAYFTVPLKHASADTLIRDMVIHEEPGRGWRMPLVRTIANYYRRAPFFDAAYPLIEQVLSSPSASIADMARVSLTRVADYLGITTTLVPSTTTYANADLKGQARVIDTCLRESADHYINAIGGQELYTKDEFAARGIRLNFLKSDPVEYEQFQQPFVPALSMIDVLMFNSRDAARALLDRYALV
jgi:hypothetical protein